MNEKFKKSERNRIENKIKPSKMCYILLIDISANYEYFI